MGTNLKRVAVLAVGAVLALSACGGDDSDDVSAGGAVESLPGEATDGGADATDAPSGTERAPETRRATSSSTVSSALPPLR